MLSSRAPDKYIRPVITFVIFASGLKYVGMSTKALGWTLALVLVAAAVYWMVARQPWRRGRKDEAAAGHEVPAEILNGLEPAAGQEVPAEILDG